jgi:MFS family permease
MTNTLSSADSAARLRGARTAVMLSFAVNGFCFASWLARTPAVRDGLGLNSAQLGLLLLCLSGGGCLALPAAGPVVQRFGPARVVLIGSIGMFAGLVTLAAALGVATVWLAAIGLVLVGVSNSTWDVAMNVEGADVEQRRGRPLMPKLHAAFSLGTVAGGAAGAVLASWSVPALAQVVAAAVLAPTSMVIATRAFLPPRVPDAAADAGSVRSASGGLRAWGEPRTLLIGLLTLCFAFTEGSANDWLAVALVDGHHSGETLAALGYGVFVAAMTVGRLSGTALLIRYGRVPVLRVTAVLALAGLLMVILGPNLPVVFAGAVVWGLGASLGFPVGMSAAADDPVRAATRVGVVSSIAYTAFLAGPPLIGLLAQHIGILRGLFVVVGALIVGLMATGAARPLAKTE